MSGLKINPTDLYGAWTRGWALDVHTTASVFLGYDEQGHARYDTTRSPLGELLYQLKYRGQDLADQVAEVIAGFLTNLPNVLARIDLIVPAPPSTVRPRQPVVQVAGNVGRRLGKPVAKNSVRKTRDTPGLKDIHDPEVRREILHGAFELERNQVNGKGVLLIDDLYRSGATANAVTLALYAAGATRVYFLAATRTRSST